jgi:exodeoxyribonuclease VII large subunit
MQTSLFGNELIKKPSGSPKKRAKRKLAAPLPAVLPDTEAPETLTEKVLGVNDFLDYINAILKVVEDVKVQGEISRISVHPTGIYMTLKDKEGDCVLDCYINPYTYRGLGLTLEEGMEVKVSGVPGIFKRRSQLSFRVENVELAGEGTLKKAYELLKLKLQTEGLFDRKRELPEFISTIGVITSKTGAVIDDFRNNLDKQGFKIFFKDCRVEGVQAVGQITAALQYFNKHHPNLDCLVVMRGGGSLEDLQAFNNELLVKEMFASRIPIVAAIGHDRDVPLACLVADKYTSTPTAAAILINTSWQRLATQLPHLQSLLISNYKLALENERATLSSLTHQLTGNFNQVFNRYSYLAEKIRRGGEKIENLIDQSKKEMQIFASKLYTEMNRAIQTRLETVASTEKLIYAASPERNLKLGYSLAYNREGQIIRKARDVKAGENLKIKLHQGSIDTNVINIQE